jgi:UDP-2,3-diacylglucosamine hydrolase
VNRLFLSDLHLDDPDGRHFRRFAQLLETSGSRVQEIYLLGDLCEIWVGDDDDGPLATALVDVLRRASARTRIRVMAGNRDFLFASDFERRTGAELIPDPCPIGNGMLLSHGDAFCIDDQDYQRVRRMLRSSAWQQEVLSRSLAERRALAAAMRAESAATNANKAENIMDVSPTEIARVMAAHHAQVLIHGHTHRPGVHRHAWGRRYVLGAWERCGWAVREDESGSLRLRCFPREGRCEI